MGDDDSHEISWEFVTNIQVNNEFCTRAINTVAVFSLLATFFIFTLPVFNQSIDAKVLNLDKTDASKVECYNN